MAKFWRGIKPEEKLQVSVAELLDYQGWRYMHCPNEGKRPGGLGGRLVAQGLKSGVPDILIFEPVEGGYNGVAMELKIYPNKPTPAQIEWLSDLSYRWWLAVVCYSMDEVVDALQYVEPINGRPMVA